MSLEKATAEYKSLWNVYGNAVILAWVSKKTKAAFQTRRAAYFAALADAHGVTVADVSRIAGTLAQLAAFAA